MLLKDSDSKIISDGCLLRKKFASDFDENCSSPSNFNGTTHSNENKIFQAIVNLTFVFTMLKELSVFAAGPNAIPLIFLKRTVNVTFIVNLCFSSTTYQKFEDICNICIFAAESKLAGDTKNSYIVI